MNLIKIAVVSVALIGSPIAMSAPIVWGSAQNTTSALDVLTSGSLVEAFNAGPSNAGSVIVNGVAFANTDALLPSSTPLNMLNGATSGNASYNELLSTIDFGGGNVFSLNNIGAGNLLAGSNYLLQVWFTDLRTASVGRVMTFGDGLGSNVNLSATGSGLGQFAVGQFTANSASQTLALASSMPNVHLTAYQLRMVEQINPVPVPAPLFLLGLGLLALGARSTLRR